MRVVDQNGKSLASNRTCRYSGGFGRHLAGGELSVDANHNQLISVTNSGVKPAEARLTLHYDNGEKSYEMQQTILPGDQMLVNVSSLIHDRVPDRSGHTLPAVLTLGSYDVRDLSAGQSSRGYLTESSLVVDQVLGASVIPLGVTRCSCTLTGPIWSPDDFFFLEVDPDGDMLDAEIVATDECDGTLVDASGDFTSWLSSDTAVATVATKKVTAVGAGTATATADGSILESTGGGTCAFVPVHPSAPVSVISFKVTGKSYIFVGNDPNELFGNHYTATDSTGTQNPQPPGGTCCAASSDTSDTVSQTGSNPPIFQFTTLNQSTTVGDRTLTFEYDLSNGEGASQQNKVTAREFAYVTNSNPSNTCTLGHGTNRTYTYTVYTHPDHTAVLSTDGISGTAVSENFNPSLTCETITGNGSLNTNAQFSDDITSACSSAPLTCAQTSTQTIKVAGYPVRTNSLQWTSAGVTYTSEGPTQ
jgi:hypothetical protein